MYIYIYICDIYIYIWFYGYILRMSIPYWQKTLFSTSGHLTPRPPSLQRKVSVEARSKCKWGTTLQQTWEFHIPSLLNENPLQSFFSLSLNCLRKTVSPVHKNGNDAAPRDPVQKSFSVPQPFTRVSRLALKHLISTGHPVTPIGTKRWYLGFTWTLWIAPWGPVFQKSSSSDFLSDCTFWHSATWSQDAISFISAFSVSVEPAWFLIHWSLCLLSALVFKTSCSSKREYLPVTKTLSQNWGIHCFGQTIGQHCLTWNPSNITVGFQPFPYQETFNGCSVLTATRNGSPGQDVIHGSAISNYCWPGLTLQNMFRVTPLTVGIWYPCPHHSNPQQPVHWVA